MTPVGFKSKRDRERVRERNVSLELEKVCFKKKIKKRNLPAQ